FLELCHDGKHVVCADLRIEKELQMPAVLHLAVVGEQFLIGRGQSALRPQPPHVFPLPLRAFFRVAGEEFVKNSHMISLTKDTARGRCLSKRYAIRRYTSDRAQLHPAPPSCPHSRACRAARTSPSCPLPRR